MVFSSSRLARTSRKPCIGWSRGMPLRQSKARSWSKRGSWHNRLQTPSRTSSSFWCTAAVNGPGDCSGCSSRRVLCMLAIALLEHRGLWPRPVLNGVCAGRGHVCCSRSKAQGRGASQRCDAQPPALVRLCRALVALRSRLRRGGPFRVLSLGWSGPTETVRGESSRRSPSVALCVSRRRALSLALLGVATAFLPRMSGASPSPRIFDCFACVGRLASALVESEKGVGAGGRASGDAQWRC